MRLDEHKGVDMKRVRRVFGVALVAAVAVAVVASLAAAESSAVTLDGSFVWVADNDDDSDVVGDLEAVFTPTGDNEWDVAFHFMWEGAPRVFAGTAVGSLTSGDLSGEVEDDREGREPTVFRFSGAFEGETYHGKHGILQEGEYKSLGTLTLAARD